MTTNFGATTPAGTVTVKGTNITIFDTTQTALAGVTTTGTASITSGGAVSQSAGLSVAGNLTVTATAGAVDFTTGAFTNNFGSIGVTSGGAVTITEASPTQLTTVSATGTLVVSSTGSIVASGAVTATGNATFTATSGDAAGSRHGIISLDAVGSAFTGVTLSGGTVTIRDSSGTLDLAAAADSQVNDQLTVNASGNVTATNDILGGAIVSITAVNSVGVDQDVTLSGAANEFTSLAFVANDVTITNSVATGGTSLEASTISGNYSLTSANAVSELGTLAITGNLTIAAGTTSITIDSGNSTIDGLVDLVGDDITVSVASGLALNRITAAGDLSLTADGDITDDGTILTLGAVNVLIDAGATHSVILDEATRAFTGSSVVYVGVIVILM
jgi:hypothetical protein